MTRKLIRIAGWVAVSEVVTWAVITVLVAWGINIPGV